MIDKGALYHAEVYFYMQLEIEGIDFVSAVYRSLQVYKYYAGENGIKEAEIYLLNIKNKKSKSLELF